jgi:transposase
VLRERLSRAQVEVRLANMAPCMVGMEACVEQKNDFNDAQAIAEAATRPTVRYVSRKPPAQLDQQVTACAIGGFPSVSASSIRSALSCSSVASPSTRAGAHYAPSCRAPSP